MAATDGSAEALDAFVRARLAEEAGNPAASLSALRTVSSLAPGLPGVRGRMLEQAIQAGDFDAARSAAAALWDSGDRRFDAQLVLTVDALRRSDWKAARTYLAGQQDKAGVDVIARLIAPTINAWIDVGARAKRPERHLIAASPAARPEPALLLEATLVELAARRGDDAVALLDTIKPTDRSSQLVALRVVSALRAAGRDDAADGLERRIALARSEGDDPLTLLSGQPVATPRAGAAHWLALLADGLGRTPHGSPAVPLLFARAAGWLNEEDWQVRAVLTDALVRNGQAADALALLGDEALPPVLTMRRAELVADAGDPAAAIVLAERAAAAEDTPRSLLLRYADIAREAADDAAAERAYRRLEASLGVGDAPLRAAVLVARADLVLRTQGWDAAEPLIDRALKLGPDDPMVLNFAGYSAIERRRDVDASLKMIEAAWAKEPQNPSITDSLGWAYVLTGRLDEAVPLLEKAQRGEPENAVIVEHLGDAYWKAGHRFSARYVWRAAALVADADMATRIETKLRDGLTAATLAP
ncbi:tetratricopeptide repeat protein [Sphingopyxis panaciterrulae]|uniref:Tetratricopeptide (TPR) repeat protein n=1 Tax=Sphingopyxis panaciterrulae TaxID=462372 RepID=A0A7W9B6H5_9SPHN|nr:tetratricopeptide repeat protein [Sphingopyxis panaciterrulae]MBB5706897.1 tetratricopeptide (TPR) repeat protein [Sphingopyxis panaciterrulae]